MKRQDFINFLKIYQVFSLISIYIYKYFESQITMPVNQTKQCTFSQLSFLNHYINNGFKETTQFLVKYSLSVEIKNEREC